MKIDLNFETGTLSVDRDLYLAEIISIIEGAGLVEYTTDKGVTLKLDRYRYLVECDRPEMLMLYKDNYLWTYTPAQLLQMKPNGRKWLLPDGAQLEVYAIISYSLLHIAEGIEDYGK